MPGRPIPRGLARVDVGTTPGDSSPIETAAFDVLSVWIKAGEATEVALYSAPRAAASAVPVKREDRPSVQSIGPDGACLQFDVRSLPFVRLVGDQAFRAAIALE